MDVPRSTKVCTNFADKRRSFGRVRFQTKATEYYKAEGKFNTNVATMKENFELNFKIPKDQN
jgi:hypothetical protein